LHVLCSFGCAKFRLNLEDAVLGTNPVPRACWTATTELLLKYWRS
jgi:hypothetical protein